MGKVWMTLLITASFDDRIKPVESAVSSVNVPDPDTISHLMKFSPGLRKVRDVMERVSPTATLYVVVSPSIETLAFAPAAKTKEQRIRTKKTINSTSLNKSLNAKNKLAFPYKIYTYFNQKNGKEIYNAQYFKKRTDPLGPVPLHLQLSAISEHRCAS